MRPTFLSMVVLGALLLHAGIAVAQVQTPPDSRPERPYRGLFASGTDQAAQVLTANGSLGVGYDTNPLLNQAEVGLIPGGVPATVSRSGSSFGSLSGGLSYSGAFDSVNVGASLSSSARYYPGQASTFTTGHGASGGINVALGRSTKAAASGNFSYQPVRSFQPFPIVFEPALGHTFAPDFAFGSGQGAFYAYSAGGSLTQQLSQRSSLSAAYDRQQIDTQGTSAQGLSTQTGSVRFAHSMTRRLGLRLGYGFTDVGYVAGGGQYRNHNIDSGVDYSRNFSVTRRTKFAFSTGGSAISQLGTTRYNVTGNATLSREIGRSWDAGLTYNRNVGFIAAVREPVFFDAVSAGLRGLITRRVSFSSSVSATTGHIGVAPGAQRIAGFDAWTASAGVGTALHRHLSIGVSYSYYRYAFNNTPALANNLLSEVGRHSVVMSLSAWAPLVQHGRKTDASR